MSTDEEGITAIIALQKMAGINFTREQAAAAWSGFSEAERAQTMRVYRIFVKPDSPASAAGRN